MDRLPRRRSHRPRNRPDHRRRSRRHPPQHQSPPAYAHRQHHRHARRSLHKWSGQWPPQLGLQRDRRRHLQPRRRHLSLRRSHRDLTTGDGAGLKAAFDRVTYAAAEANIVLVAAAGNDGMDLSNPRYMELPAQSRGVLAIVASTNPACGENTSPEPPISRPRDPRLLQQPRHSRRPRRSRGQRSLRRRSGRGWIRGACSSGKPFTIDGPPSTRPTVSAVSTSATSPTCKLWEPAPPPRLPQTAALIRATIQTGVPPPSSRPCVHSHPHTRPAPSSISAAAALTQP